MTLHADRLRPTKRYGYWYLARRVPKTFQCVEKRRVVFISSGIRIKDDPFGTAAREVIAKLDAELFARWRRLVAGESPEGRFEAAVATARDLGITYLPAEKVAELTAREVVDRLVLLGNPTEQPDLVIESVTGTVPEPGLKLSGLREEYEKLIKTTLVNKSPHQLKRWQEMRDRAVTVFIDVLKEDKPVARLTRDDAMKFRAHLQNRVVAEEIEIDTANKNLGRIATMYRVFDEANMLGLPPIFDKIQLRGGKDQQRVPYKASFVQSHFMAEGMFDDINPEERRLILLLAESGLRPAEACNLRRETIILNHPIPHVKVLPDGRELKTDQSQRDIPLVGVALHVMKLQPDGFPRYRDRPNQLSAVVNKALTARKLRPNGESLYSLRHCFKDRLRAARVETELMDELMGHKTHKPAYGDGYTLEVKAKVLKKIAFRPPSTV